MISKSLTLPDGYQTFDSYCQIMNEYRVCCNNNETLIRSLSIQDSELYCYTQHQVFYEEGVLKQTRSGPNWDGGMVTLCTCKHRMRTYNRPWLGTWIVGLAPKECDNCLCFAGVVKYEFVSNYDLGVWLRSTDERVWTAKQANDNPRGDLYLPRRPLKATDKYRHANFVAPVDHTRSVEFYNKSPGSTSIRPDGKIVKWWRDIEYLGPGSSRPKVFVLSPCWLFSKPMLYTSYDPKRAALKLTTKDFARCLRA